MPYEVFSPFYRCAAIPNHGVHCKLKEAATCFDEIKKCNNGNIPINPISGKYIHAIVAVDDEGNQRDFKKQEMKLVKSLGLDPKSVIFETPGITTFYDTAQKYYEALRLAPISGFNLGKLFDFKNKEPHFWFTDAGIGLALTYTQHALFTLELSLKAVLEVFGKLIKNPNVKRPHWQTHDPIVLFELLEKKHRQKLEQRWASLSKSERRFNGTLTELLNSYKDSYEKWRYIPEMKDALSINIGALLDASRLLLDFSFTSFRQNSPYKLKITTQIITDSEGAKSSTTNPARNPTAIIEGEVRRVCIPKSYDPHSRVKVVINSDQHEHDITTEFYMHYVESYYGLEGERVVLGGTINECEPYVLINPQHIGEQSKPSRVPSYTFENRNLKGSVYNIKTSVTAFGLSQNSLILKDMTFFSEVECLFLTNEEKGKLEGIHLGNEIFKSGFVTLLNGRPIVMVGPDKIDQVESTS